MACAITAYVFESFRCAGYAVTPAEDAVVLPIAGDALLVGALLLRVAAQFEDLVGAPAMPRGHHTAIATLRALSPAETWRLGGMRKSGLALLIDTRQLAENLRALRRINEEAVLLAYFVRHRASRAMLHRMFHVSHSVIVRQQRRLGARVGQGRPRLPDKQTRDAIHHCWADSGRTEADVRRRLVQLHQRFSAYPLVALHRVIHEFDTPR
jgi:hypothetical protein